MDTNILWIVVVGAIAAIAGYFFGMADSRVTGALKESRAKDAAARASAAGTAAPAPVDEHTVLKITVDPTLKWHLQLDGLPIGQDTLTAEQRARLVNIIVQMRPWIDAKVSNAPAPSGPVVAPAAVASYPAVSAQTPAKTTPVAKPAGPPRLDPLRGFRSLLESEVVKPETVRPPSIVSMIDEVLQKKLANSPYAEKRIRLEEGSVGEVVVYVGVQRYSGVDAVPDDGIKALIHSAIAEWDKA